MLTLIAQTWKFYCLVVSGFGMPPGYPPMMGAPPMGGMPPGGPGYPPGMNPAVASTMQSESASNSPAYVEPKPPEKVGGQYVGVNFTLSSKCSFT